MNRAIRTLLVVLLTVSGAMWSAGLARADVNNSNGTNVQNGNNRSTGTQSGSSKSGAAVGGQVTGVVSSGRTSVDATNHSTNSDVTSGDAKGTNTANSFTGLNASNVTNIGAADITGSSADNLQNGDNRSAYTQTINATTGDGVAGEVIGVVTAAGGSASIVAANTSSNDSVTTGDASGTNAFAAFTGLNLTETTTTVAADITDSCPLGCANVQDGNNRSTSSQTVTDKSGDGIAGQVIGAVAGGATSIDARNTSDSVDVETGQATSDNHGAFFTGLNTSDTTTVAADIANTCNPDTCANLQNGNNTQTNNQTASSTSGDGVGGEVIGAVTSAGGSASIVAANTSKNSDITTGDAKSTNELASFVGLNTAGTTTVAADISGSCPNGCDNVQDGSNRLTGDQTASAVTGSGVGGQVLGVVSAGAASLDATNTTDDSSVTTGDSKATNAASEFVGLGNAPTTTVGSGAATDITGASADNLQDGANRKTLGQTASATSGDAVAGQVSGVVTSAGGSASVVLANNSTSIDSTSGQGNFSNSDHGFVGLNTGSGPLTV